MLAAPLSWALALLRSILPAALPAVQPAALQPAAATTTYLPTAAVPPVPVSLAGSGRSLLAECLSALLDFFATPEACELRLVCREFQAAVAAHPWEDRKTVILGSIGAWRACFPRARCANVRMLPLFWHTHRTAPLVDADFVHFEGLWELNMSFCKDVTDAALAHLRGIRVLNMSGCLQLTLTDAGLAHLAGISRLSIAHCSQASITNAAFAALRGIRVLNMSGCPQFTDAAFAHLQGIHSLIMDGCTQLTITDAALVHLKGITNLSLMSCAYPFTEAGLIHLRGAQVSMWNAHEDAIAAARGVGLPVATGLFERFDATFFIL